MYSLPPQNSKYYLASNINITEIEKICTSQTKMTQEYVPKNKNLKQLRGYMSSTKEKMKFSRQLSQTVQNDYLWLATNKLKLTGPPCLVQLGDMTCVAE